MEYITKSIKLYLKTAYFDLTEDIRRTTKIFPPNARGSAAECFAACTQEHVKKFKNLN